MLVSFRQPPIGHVTYSKNQTTTQTRSQCTKLFQNVQTGQFDAQCHAWFINSQPDVSRYKLIRIYKNLNPMGSKNTKSLQLSVSPRTASTKLTTPLPVEPFKLSAPSHMANVIDDSWKWQISINAHSSRNRIYWSTVSSWFLIIDSARFLCIVYTQKTFKKVSTRQMKCMVDNASHVNRHVGFA